MDAGVGQEVAGDVTSASSVPFGGIDPATSSTTAVGGSLVVPQIAGQQWSDVGGSGISASTLLTATTGGGPVVVVAATRADLSQEKGRSKNDASKPLVANQSEEKKDDKPEEHTGFRTMLATQAARLVVLFCHGLFLYLASRDLKTLDEDSWRQAFVPIWIGNAVCICLLLWSVCASCPYIKRSQQARRVRVGIYPSLLTEIFPQIVVNVLGVIFMLILTSGEWTMYRYLATKRTRRLVESTVFLIIVCMLTTCNGALLTHNSPLYLSLGVAVFSSLMIHLFVRNGEPEEQAWTLVPSVVAAAVIFLSMLHRLSSHIQLLGCCEVLVRCLEVLALLGFFLALGSTFLKHHDGQLEEASLEGMVAGGAMCLVALLRAILCYWETVDRGTLEERVIDACSVPGEGTWEEDEEQPQEVQLPERKPKEQLKLHKKKKDNQTPEKGAAKTQAKAEAAPACTGAPVKDAEDSAVKQVLKDAEDAVADIKF